MVNLMTESMVEALGQMSTKRPNTIASVPHLLFSNLLYTYVRISVWIVTNVVVCVIVLRPLKIVQFGFDDI